MSESKVTLCLLENVTLNNAKIDAHNFDGVTFEPQNIELKMIDNFLWLCAHL